jgi:hypothetical protein
MRTRAFALWLTLPALLAGCAGGTAAARPTVTVTVTQTVIATPTPTPTLTPSPTQSGPLQLGTVFRLTDGATVTVFEHRKGVEPQDPNQEAIDIQVCVPANGSGTNPTIDSSFWSLRDAAGHSYPPASTMWKHPGATPGFWPPEQQVKWGDCYRAWVIIEGSKRTTMTTARYSNTDAGVVAEWALPQ